MVSEQRNCLSLCAGIGGLELGLRILWPELRTVCHVERESFPAAVLCARMAEQALDPAVVADDLQSFDGRPWRGIIHCIAACPPCQPFSAAGRRKGKADERWLGEDFLRIVDEVRPEVIVMENVPGFLTGGLDAILGGLERIEAGWSAEWGLFRADATVRSPHRRERFFLVAERAVADSSDDLRWRGKRREEAGTWQDGERGRRPSGGSERLADSGSNGLEDNEQTGATAGATSGQFDPMADSDGGRFAWPPGPEDRDGWRDYIAAGGPAPSLPGIRRGIDGVPEELEYAKDRLRALGNAVIPIASAYAVAKLVERLRQ